MYDIFKFSTIHNSDISPVSESESRVPDSNDDLVPRKKMLLNTIVVFFK